MTDVEVYHAVVAVGPDDREIAEADHVLDADREILLRERKEHLDILTAVRGFVPHIPFAARGHKFVREVFGYGMVLGVDLEQSGLRRPAVAEESSGAEEFVVPWPFGRGVVVTGGVEADPASAVLHILFESLSLGFLDGSRVDADYHIVILEPLIRIVVKRGGLVENVSFAPGEAPEEIVGLIGENHMVGFGRVAVVEQGFEARCVGIIAGIVGRLLSAHNAGCCQHQQHQGQNFSCHDF